MLSRQFTSCLLLIVAAQVAGACIGALLAMNWFPTFDYRALGVILLTTLAGLAITLALLCGVIEFKTPDDGDPPLGIGA